MEGLPSLDHKPAKITKTDRGGRKTHHNHDDDERAKRKEALSKLSKAEKLKLLDENLLDSYIIAMESGDLKPMELGAVVTYLKNNKEIAEKKEHSEADLITELVQE